MPRPKSTNHLCQPAGRSMQHNECGFPSSSDCTFQESGRLPAGKFVVKSGLVNFGYMPSLTTSEFDAFGVRQVLVTFIKEL